MTLQHRQRAVTSNERSRTESTEQQQQPSRQKVECKMARKVDKTPKLCVICGDKAKGINFNALTCMSCKAFFRRNALRNKEMKCPFNDSCQVDKITRKFCSKCRLKKCFDLGMKKEWILSEEEKRLIKEKIMRNRIRRQQQEMESQQPSLTTSQTGLTGKRRSMENQGKLSVGGGKLGATGKRRAASKSSAFVSAGKGGSFRNRTGTGSNGFESSQTNSSVNASAGNLFAPLNNNSVPYTQPATASNFAPGVTSSTPNQNKFTGASAAINAYNIFQEPSAYSLDILLSDNCDEFFEAGGNNVNSYNSNTAPQSNSVLDDWLYGNPSAGQGQEVKPVVDPKQKQDDFLPSLSSEIDDPLSLNNLNDCCNLLFSNNLNTMDLFEDGLTFSGSSSGISDCNESNQSPMYETNPAMGATGTGLVSDLVEIKKDLLVSENLSNTGHITNVTTGSNSTFEYSQAKSENDFTQYLLHDNDPTFNPAIMNPPAATITTTIANTNRSTNLLLNQDKAVNFQVLNSNLNPHANNQVAVAQKSFPTWDGANALQVVSPRYASNSESYPAKSKVPPLVKMGATGGIATGATNAESNDFISTCLISTNDQAEDSCNYDPVIEFVPRIGTNDVMFREIGFSNRELILPERCLIKELTDACTVLKNPYKRILVFNNYDSVRSCRITEYSFHRLIRMSKRLSRFSQLPLSDQAKMLKFSLLEMLAIRSVLVYNPDRESWGFIDDKCKVNVMVRMDVIRPFCTKCGFQRHKNFPTLFRHEWKNDNIIFDLLTAIVLFTPRPGMCEFEKIKEEHLRYVYLLRRYLEIKYPTIAEAKDSFASLMNHVDEMRHLNADIIFFFRSYSQLLQTSPLFTQLLDLESSSQTTMPPKPVDPINVNSVDGSFGGVNGTAAGGVFDESNLFSGLDVNVQLDNIVRAASTGSTASSTSSVTQQQHYGGNTYTGTLDTSTVATDAGGSMSFGVGVNSSSSSTNSSSNAYRECILNSAT